MKNDEGLALAVAKRQLSRARECLSRAVVYFVQAGDEARARRVNEMACEIVKLSRMPVEEKSHA